MPTVYLSLMERALSQRLSGQWPAASELYRDAIDRAVKRRDITDLREATLAAGHTFREAGDPAAAADVYELSIRLSELHNDPGWGSRAFNGLGIIAHEMGQLEVAIGQYRRAEALALESADLLGVGNVCQNIGSIESIRGNCAEALASYARAHACFKELGNERALAGVLNNIGMVHVDVGDFVRAAESFDAALKFAARSGDLKTTCIILSNATELHIGRGDWEPALVCCRKALDLAAVVADSRVQADALKYLGVIHRHTGGLSSSEEYLRQAIAVSESSSNPLTQAESHRELAILFRIADRNQEALQEFNSAYHLFANLQASREEKDIAGRISQLEADFLSLLGEWAESIEANDDYTGGHCSRVAEYAARIAAVAGVPADEMIWFRMGAFLHDIGKTQVPQEILNKAGPLTDAERQTIESHTVVGCELLAGVSFPWDVKRMIRSHHERWDGSGYPDGLSGERIPLVARILSCADVFDALTTSRTYRGPLTAEDALQLMSDDEGAFDPDLLDVLRGLLPSFRSLIPPHTLGAPEGRRTPCVIQ